LLTRRAREEVPELLNITSATASADSTTAGIAAVACAPGAVNTVDAAQAAKRPLAGTGAGAFTFEGAATSESARAGIRTSEAAVLALPRLRWAAAAGAGCGLVGTGLGHASAGFGGRGTKAASLGVKSGGSAKTSPVYVRTICNQKFDNSKQINQMTRSYPVTPGGMGSHPAREPDPV
jgi:hypothetical protein